MKKQWFYGFALALLFVPASFGQTAATDKPEMHDCAAMMQQHGAMKAHMAEMNSKLEKMVGEMNKARGSAKVDKTAAVITELVAQRTMMQKHMMEMQPKMMGHMIAHMKSGMLKGLTDSMSGCPMMRDADMRSAPMPQEHKQ